MHPTLCACLFFTLLTALPGRADAAAGDKMFAAGQFELARRAYAGQMADTPVQIAPRLGLIRALLRLGLWPDAVTAGQDAVRQFPADADAHGLLALALMRAGLPDEADAEARQSLAQNKDDYWGLVAAGRVSEWNSDRTQAAASYRRASVLRPGEPDAWLGLALDLQNNAADAAEEMKAIQSYLNLKPQGEPHERFVEILTEALSQRNYASSSQTDLNDLSTPIETTPSAILLPVVIDGQVFRLSLDTGGGGSVFLYSKAARRLPEKTVARTWFPAVQGKQSARILIAKTFVIGALTLKSVPLVVADTSIQDSDGVIGTGIFQSDNLKMVLDFSRKTLTLTDGNVPAMDTTSSIVPFHSLGTPYILVPVQYGTRSAWGVVDSGNAQTHFSLRMAQEVTQGVAKGLVRSGTIKQKLSFGDTAKGMDYLMLEFADLVVVPATSGPAVTSGASFGLSYLDKQISPICDFEVGVNLGVPFLTQFRRVVIDYPHHQLMLEPNPPAPTAK